MLCDSGCLMWDWFMSVAVWFALCLDLVCVGWGCGFCGFGFGVCFMTYGFVIWCWLLCCWGLLFADLLQVGGLPLWFMGGIARTRLVLIALDSYY